MPYKKRGNSIDWAKHAHWFEAEGSKPEIPIGKEIRYILTVSQDVSRRDIVDTLCNELKSAGFHPYKTLDEKTRSLRCELHRVEEQRCFIERTKPYYLSKQTKQ